jgi:GT2 family glycosyltransferase
VEETFKGQPDVVCLSGPYRYYDGPWAAQKLLNAICKIILPIGYKLFGHMVVGGNFVAKKSALEMIGGFDHTIGFYGEDVDIARRISSQGRVVFRKDFFLYTSGRRFYAEGLIKTNLRYLLNFFWINLFHKPYSETASDVRSFS